MPVDMESAPAQSGALVSPGASSAEAVVLNQDVVDQLIAQAYIDAGMTRLDDDGHTIADGKQLGSKLVDVMLTKHQATGMSDYTKKAATKFELFAEIFPTAPGVTSQPATGEEQAACDELKKQVWTLVNTGTSGYVQKRVAIEGLVLCQAGVGRQKVSLETGVAEPGTEVGKFLTKDKELILTFYASPAAQSFARAARKLENQLGMVAERRPELALDVARQASVVVKASVTAIPHASVSQVRALTGHTQDTPQIEAE